MVEQDEAEESAEQSSIQTDSATDNSTTDVVIVRNLFEWLGPYATLCSSTLEEVFCRLVDAGIPSKRISKISRASWLFIAPDRRRHQEEAVVIFVLSPSCI